MAHVYRADLAGLQWAAGFIEGEGCFHANPRKPLLSVGVNQKTREPLERLEQIFGGQIRSYRQKYRGREVPMFSWTAVGSLAAGISMTLYSLMSQRRQEQIRVALDRWKSHRAHHRHWIVCKRGHPLTADNIYVSPGKGDRKCRQCILIRSRKVEWDRRRAQGVPLRAKLTEEQVAEIRRRFAEGESQTVLCAEYNIGFSAVHHLLHGHTWKHVAINKTPEVERRLARASMTPRAKLTEDDVRAIRAAYAAGASQSALSRQYALNTSTMHHLVHGLTWKHVT